VQREHAEDRQAFLVAGVRFERGGCPLGCGEAAVPGARTWQRVQDRELGLALGYRVFEPGGCLACPQGCQVGQVGVAEPLCHERGAHARVGQGRERVPLGCLVGWAGGVPVQLVEDGWQEAAEAGVVAVAAHGLCLLPDDAG